MPTSVSLESAPGLNDGPLFDRGELADRPVANHAAGATVAAMTRVQLARVRASRDRLRTSPGPASRLSECGGPRVGCRSARTSGTAARTRAARRRDPPIGRR